MADSAPIEGTAAGGPMGIPLWGWGVGIGAVVLFLWYRKRSAASAGTGAIAGPLQGTTQVSGGGVDPYTGQPIDPFTGLPYLQSQPTNPPDLSSWVTNAENALVKAGYAPGAVASALYDYTSGNNLNTTEAGIVNKALGLVGFPPVTLPFFGTLPSHSTAASTPPPVPTNSGGGSKLAPLAALPSEVLSKLIPGEKIVGSVRASQYGPSAGYYFSNIGGVFAVGGAPFHGSYLGLPKSAQQGPGIRTFTKINLTPRGYQLVSSRGETYNF